jgi:hypothetical protein
MDREHRVLEPQGKKHTRESKVKSLGVFFSRDFERVRTQVKDEFNKTVRPILETRKGLVIKLGDAIDKYGEGTVQKEDICVTIKFYLADEIRDGLISERDIERYCPDGWKRKYVKKQCKSDNLSLTEQTAGVTTVPSEALSRPSITIPSTAETTSPPTESHGPSLVDDDYGDGGGEEKGKDLTLLAHHLADKAATIAQQLADIEALKQEKRELQEQLAQALIKPAAYAYAQDLEATQKSIKDKTADLLRPFSVCVEIDLRGQFLPVIVRVDPVTKSVTVVVDEAKARSMMV